MPGTEVKSFPTCSHFILTTECGYYNNCSFIDQKLRLTEVKELVQGYRANK